MIKLFTEIHGALCTESQLEWPVISVSSWKTTAGVGEFGGFEGDHRADGLNVKITAAALVLLPFQKKIPLLSSSLSRCSPQGSSHRTAIAEGCKNPLERNAFWIYAFSQQTAKTCLYLDCPRVPLIFTFHPIWAVNKECKHNTAFNVVTSIHHKNTSHL